MWLMNKSAVAASIARLVLFSVHYYTEDVFWYAAEESAIRYGQVWLRTWDRSTH